MSRASVSIRVHPWLFRRVVFRHLAELNYECGLVRMCGAMTIPWQLHF